MAGRKTAGGPGQELEPLFAERPTQWLVSDAYRLGAVPAGLALVAFVFGFPILGWIGLGLALCVAAFFRNPARTIPGAEGIVVSPADGRVVQVGEIEGPDGEKQLRVGIFLSVLNVHVNRMPVSGEVIEIERGGHEFMAAFRPEAESRNVYCSVWLETPDQLRVRVTQITGWIARRIVCHLAVGDRVQRGDRYGLIRFGSRTDVVLPLGSEVQVARGDRVQGGASVLARLPVGGKAS